MRNLLFGLLLVSAVAAMTSSAQAQVNCYHPGSVGYGRVGYGYSGYGYSGYRGYYGSPYGTSVYGPNVYGNAGVAYTSGFAPRVYTYGGPGLYPSRFQSGYGGYGGPVPRVRYGY